MYVIPVPVFKVKSMKAGDAAARGPFIQVKERYWDREPLIRHELVHVKQFWRSLMLHGILYNVWPWYRLHAEAEAYAEQLRHVPANEFMMTLREFALNLSTMYRLKIDRSHAYYLLMDWWGRNPVHGPENRD